eukprot:CFRG6177T1
MLGTDASLGLGTNMGRRSINTAGESHNATNEIKFRRKLNNNLRPIPAIAPKYDSAFATTPSQSPIRTLVHSQATNPSSLVVFSIAVVRVLQALSLRTAFVPDEWYQSLEIAHAVVYGRGYITWEWLTHMRGVFHPYLFVFVFKVLHLHGLDSPLALIHIPRVLQGIVEVACEVSMYSISYRFFGRDCARLSLLCSMTSWAMWYLSGRTLSNSIEMIFTTIAMNFWHWPDVDVTPDQRISQRLPLMVAACACIVRPTSALLWVLIALQYLVFTNHRMSLLVDLLWVGIPSICLSVLMDSWAFGHLVVVQWEFVKQNIYNGVAGFYGSSPSHWYLTSALPTLLTTYLPMFILGVYTAWKLQRRILLLVIVWIVFVHSFLDHKEFRFILPVLPLMHIHCGLGLTTLRSWLSNTKCTKANTNVAVSTSGINTSKTGVCPRVNRPRSFLFKLVLITIGTTQGIMGLYFALVHQQGTVQVISTLRHEIETWGAHASKSDGVHIDVTAEWGMSDCGDNCVLKSSPYRDFDVYGCSRNQIRIHFWMPCHSTPYSSHMHYDIPMRFLTCHPKTSSPLCLDRERRGADSTTHGSCDPYIDEADLFFIDPVRFIEKHYVHTPRFECTTHGSAPTCTTEDCLNLEERFQDCDRAHTNGLSNLCLPEPDTWSWWPSHIVIFDALLPTIKNLLHENGYELAHSLFHTHFPEGRVGSRVLVYRQTNLRHCTRG